MAMDGKDAFLARLNGLSKIEAAANRVVVVGADMIRAEAFRSISAGSVSGKGHVPSQPGQAPNRDTGGLQEHIETANPRALGRHRDELGRVRRSARIRHVQDGGASVHAARARQDGAEDPEAVRE